MAPRITKAKKAAAAALVGLGMPVREIAAELGMSHGSAHNAGLDRTVDPEVVQRCQETIAGRMAVASDSFLSHSLDRINELGPYQAMICSGIAFDKHIQGRLAASRNGSGSMLVQILVNIDQSARAHETPIPDVVIDGS